MKLWDVGARQLLATLIGNHDTDIVYGVAFSPDGRILATASADGTAHLGRRGVHHIPGGHDPVRPTSVDRQLCLRGACVAGHLTPAPPNYFQNGNLAE
jgi:WD domain, G-beta repeat